MTTAPLRIFCDPFGIPPLSPFRPTPRRVFDAVIFSNEVDLLEIRMRELMPFVTKFLVLESNATFTGKPKPLYFADQKDSRFKFIHPQLLYSNIPSRPQIPNRDPFDNEKHHRIAMGNFLRTAGIQDGDLLITADADEIPSAHTIHLLQNCDGYPSPMHLQLRNYLYSFEFLVDSNSWRSSVELYRKETQYRHSRKTDHCLADAGWHCSFCFRYIRDFVFKMKAYSHADRIRRPSLLNPERIQKIICKGSDIFDMLPEEFTYKELISKLGAVAKSFSGVHMPKYLLENAETYRYLLPGNCIRDPLPVSL
ncbi:uncharacterized protein [Physcomitrium patens]|uniref:uncharacterized protein isoform X2 n=1 Tax=Physcomitrium patens TaxID=3218 RepID=UPI000D15BD58|nr:beta-1,4-mannosyl-glycoprotein 4-beta-N-acetylglucosaminyltransferase-like isoform X2 [Physcomitrium patens]|eukprot:XP_024363728.1 beta-1,4-mannosyl-glycoprotein 4-beta-N-acetylglucosaminyltransferase-like isoform X2 [Physcomitrella patens]